MEALPDMIVRGRTTAGMTQNELAIAIEVKAGGSQISRWERGEHPPDPKNLHRIIAVLGLDPDETWKAFGRAIDAANQL